MAAPYSSVAHLQADGEGGAGCSSFGLQAGIGICSGRQGSLNSSFFDADSMFEVCNSREAFLLPEEIDEGVPLSQSGQYSNSQLPPLPFSQPTATVHPPGHTTNAGPASLHSAPAWGSCSTAGYGPRQGGATSSASHSPLVSAKTVAALMGAEEDLNPGSLDLMHLDGQLMPDDGASGLWSTAQPTDMARLFAEELPAVYTGADVTTAARLQQQQQQQQQQLRVQQQQYHLQHQHHHLQQSAMAAPAGSSVYQQLQQQQHLLPPPQRQQQQQQLGRGQLANGSISPLQVAFPHANQYQRHQRQQQHKQQQHYKQQQQLPRKDQRQQLPGMLADSHKQAAAARAAPAGNMSGAGFRLPAGLAVAQEAAAAAARVAASSAQASASKKHKGASAAASPAIDQAAVHAAQMSTDQGAQPIAAVGTAASGSSDTTNCVLDGQGSVKQPVADSTVAIAAAAAAATDDRLAITAASEAAQQMVADTAAGSNTVSFAVEQDATAAAAEASPASGQAAVAGALASMSSGSGADSSNDSTETQQQQVQEEDHPAVALPAAAAAAMAAAAAGAGAQEGQQPPQPRPFHHRGGGPCDHCGVLESPQWRRGPPAKPILCNACGTRFRRTHSLGPPIPSSGRVGGARAAAGGGSSRGGGSGGAARKRPAETLGPAPLPVNFEGGVHTGTRQARNPNRRPSSKASRS